MFVHHPAARRGRLTAMSLAGVAVVAVLTFLVTAPACAATDQSVAYQLDPAVTITLGSVPAASPPTVVRWPRT